MVPLCHTLSCPKNMYWWKFCLSIIWMFSILPLWSWKIFTWHWKETEWRSPDFFFFFFTGAHRSSDLQLYGIGCQIGPRVDRQTAELSAELRHLRHMLQVLQLPLVNCHAHDLSCLDKVSPSQGVVSRLYFGVCWKDENWGSVLTWIGHHWNEVFVYSDSALECAEKTEMGLISLFR